VPGAVEALVARAFARRPEDRFQRAADIAEPVDGGARAGSGEIHAGRNTSWSARSEWQGPPATSECSSARRGRYWGRWTRRFACSRRRSRSGAIRRASLAWSRPTTRSVLIRGLTRCERRLPAPDGFTIARR
jgi:hypothetical protein